MSRTRSAGLVALVALLVVALVATAAVVVLVRRPLPTTSGELVLAGLSGPVQVLRDARGVPTVVADDPEDLFRAQGFVHAQDRFFQMDLRRHVTAGRLAELVGDAPEAVEADVVVRTLGWRRVAEEELPLLAPETRTYLQAYADGVNAYVDGRSPGELSAAYTALGVRGDLPPVEEWTPVDSLAWLKAMAWSLRANYDEELARAAAYGAVGDVALVEQLFPSPTAVDAPPVVLGPGDTTPAAATRPADGPLPAADPGAAVAAALGDPAEPVAATARAAASVTAVLDRYAGLGAGGADGLGSNAWAVAGTHTESGAPLLAGDPHLAVSFPSTWSQVHLRCRERSAACPFDVAGFSFAGMPGVVVGRTPDVAWSLTNTGADVSDLFLERVRDGSALVAGREVPLETRTETIEVADADPVAITVRSSGHGPLLSDAVPALAAAGRRAPVPETAPAAGDAGYAVALRWTALTPGRSMDAVLALGAVTGWEDFREAASLLEVPGQTLVYADTTRVGYQVTGSVPVRQRGTGLGQQDGTWPRPGWDPAYDWAGTVPFEDLPSAVDPADGLVVSANQQATAEGPALSQDLDQGYRAARIRAALEAQVAEGRPVTVEDMAALQGDDVDPFAEVLVPALLSAPLPSGDGTTAEQRDFTREATALLRGWDGSTPPDSAAAAYYYAVWSNVLRLTFADQLPDVAQPSGGSRWYTVVGQLLQDPDSPWWDDATTPAVVETRDQVLGRALVDARLELTASLGADPQEWQWGRLHRLTLRNQVLGTEGVPAPVRSLFTAGPVEVGGSGSVVDATSWDARRGYDVVALPSMRMVVDMGDADAGRWVDVAGVSEHPWSGHRTDQLETYAEGGSFPWAFTPEGVAAAAQDELTLVPRPQG